MRRLAGVTLIAGSLLFFVGAVTPVNSRVFGTDDPLLKLLYIEEDPAAWDLAMTLLGLGGLIEATGLVPLARSVQQVTDRRILGVIAYGAATLAIGGAVSWVVISSVRIAQSPFEVVFRGCQPLAVWDVSGLNASRVHHLRCCPAPERRSEMAGLDADRFRRDHVR